MRQHNPRGARPRKGRTKRKPHVNPLETSFMKKTRRGARHIVNPAGSKLFAAAVSKNGRMADGTLS